MSPQVNHRAIAQVLDGTSDYDGLGELDQAIVRNEWAERMVALRTSLNYVAEFIASGESYSEIDEDGNVVVRSAPA